MCKTVVIAHKPFVLSLLSSQIRRQLPDLGPVYTTPEEYENGALFLRLGLPSTLNRRNCPPKTELFENALESGALRFSVDEKYFETVAFRKR